MKLLSCLALCLAVFSAFGQSLPRGLSDAEKQLLVEGYLHPATTIPGAFTSTDPPANPRAMAEWEELQALVITWTSFPEILTEIVRAAREEVTVIIVTTNPASVQNYLESNGVDLSSNVEFVETGFNTIWVRDYGPNAVYVNGVDSLVLVDWIYNRPRPKDDLASYSIGEHLGVTVHGTTQAPDDLVNTGGNFMSDGLGRAFASNLVLDENGPGNNFGFSNHNEEAVDDIMERFMGITEYAKMTVLPFDAIHHIDMHMKLLDESTLLVGQYPDGIADGPQIEANLQYIIAAFKQANGHDYNVIRMPMPPDDLGRYPNGTFNSGDYRTYTNSVFVNNTILVPTYEEKYDTTALRIWSEAMPGYHIVGIDCNAIIPLSGALHCITKEIGVNEPLWISHVQPGAFSAGEEVILKAGIRHQSGIAEGWLFYREKGASAYDSVGMTDEGQNQFSALPFLSGGEDFAYYFKAKSNSGKTAVRPATAPDGYFRLHVESETSAVDGPEGKPVDFTIYPNPAGSITCISIDYDHQTACSVVIRDMHGRTVLNVFEGTIQAGENRFFFDAGKLVSGVYSVEILSDEFHEVRLCSVR